MRRAAEAQTAEEDQGAQESPSKPVMTGRRARDPAKEGEETTLYDIARNVAEIPRGVAGGISDALHETGAAIHDLGVAWGDSKIGGIIYEPGKGLRLASGEELRQVPGPLEKAIDLTVPDIDPNQTPLGGMTRGVAKFSTGFLLAGKLKPIQALSKLGTAGRVAAPMVRGAISDFAVFDPQEERLSNLIQEFPALENPVTEYLAADPADGDAEGRFKEAAEGLGLGLLTEGFTRGLRALRGMRRAKVAAGIGDDVTRQALDRAQEQRRALTEVIGDPESRSLEIRAPAAAQGADQPGEVFVNWSRINAHDDVKAMIQELADARGGNIKNAARGTRTWQATRASAEQLDAWEILQSRRVGQPLNGEETVAVRELWVRSGSRVRELARRLNATPSDVHRIALEKQWAVHNAIQEQVIPARTETARALNAWKIRVGDAADFAGQYDQLRSLTEIPSSRGVADELAKRIIGLTDAGLEKEADALLWGARLAKTSAMVRQGFYGAMLSGPHTHARNAIGTSATIPFQILERRVAALIGKARGQQYVPDEEAAAMLFGAISGFRRAFRFSAKGRKVFSEARRLRIAGDPEAARELLARNTDDVGTFFANVASGQSGFGAGKIEVPREGAFAQAAGDNPFARVARVMDTATTAPMRALSASDEIFKTITFDMELNAQALRRVNREILDGTIEESARLDRISDLLSNPSAYMKLAAQDFAERSTFTQRPGAVAAGFNKLANSVPVLGRIVHPFRSTPFNIASFVFRRTAVSPFMQQWREDILAGGARADIAWSQFLVGNAALLTLADYAMRGDVTGVGPSNPSEKAALRRLGWQPNSVRVRTGGTDANPTYRYYSYRNMEPLSAPFALSADTVDILKYQDWEDDNHDLQELIIATTGAISNQLIAQNYMSGFSAIIEAMSDSQRYGENYWQRLATMPIPRGVAQAARASDPTMRMVTNIQDAIRAQTPGLSKDLPPARDVWGRPIIRASGLGTVYDIVSPMYSSSTENAEPIDKAILSTGAYVGMPSKSFAALGARVSLRNKPEIYSRYVQLAGNELKLRIFGGEYGAKDALNALVTGRAGSNSDAYNRGTDGPDGTRADMVDDIVNLYREAARQQIVDEFPELRAQLEERRQEKAEAMRLRPR